MPQAKRQHARYNVRIRKTETAMLNSSPDQWRRRLLILRGMLIVVLALVALTTSLQNLDLLTPKQAAIWLTLLWLPSVWYWPTRKLSLSMQSAWLTADLLSDSLLFMALIYTFGGAANPLTFYLLIPVMVAGLSLPLVRSVTITAISIGGYGLLLYWHAVPSQHSGLHAITHDMHSLHGQGMWLAFSLIGIILTLLGQALQRARRDEQTQQATALSLALQREKMYQLAGSLADRAHELNTPLSTLLLLLEELQDDTPDPESLRNGLHQAQQLAERMATVLKQDIASQAGNGQATLSSLCKDIRQPLKLLAPTMTLQCDLNDDPTLAPASSWQRILLNLGYNASDAGATTLHIACRSEGQDWLLQISDDGPRHSDSAREGLGIGLALIETTLATLQARIEYRFDKHWTQALILIPMTRANTTDATAPADS